MKFEEKITRNKKRSREAGKCVLFLKIQTKIINSLLGRYHEVRWFFQLTGKKYVIWAIYQIFKCPREKHLLLFLVLSLFAGKMRELTQKRFNKGYFNRNTYLCFHE